MLTVRNDELNVGDSKAHHLEVAERNDALGRLTKPLELDKGPNELALVFQGLQAQKHLIIYFWALYSYSTH